MMRAKTKADYAREAAAASTKYAKEHDYYWSNPTTKHSSAAGAAVYRAEAQRRIDAAQEERDELVREKAKKAAFTKLIADSQGAPGAVTSDQLYERGLVSREAGEGLEASTLLWQALICGEGRAAYPLFQMLHDGEAGVGKNMEMAGMVLFIGRKYNEKNCIKTPNLKIMPFDAAEAVFYSVCTNSRKFFAKNKISPEILASKLAAANEALDGYSKSGILKTRDDQEPMVSVFAHEDDLIYEVEAAGVSSESGSGGHSPCIIL